MGWDRFAVMLRQHRSGLKAVLTDQASSRGSATSTPTRSSSPRGCATTATSDVALDDRDPPALPRDHRDPDRGHQARRLDAGRRAVRRPRRQARATTSSSTRSTTARACPAVAAATSSSAEGRRPVDLLLRAVPGLMTPSAPVREGSGSGGPGLVASPRVSEVPHHEGLQVLRRHHRPGVRARRHRGGGSERLGQVQRRRRRDLGARGAEPAGAALAEDGRRHLHGHRHPPRPRAAPRSPSPSTTARAACPSTGPR